jgi:CBS domain containing-hemolysin-like protein
MDVVFILLAMVILLLLQGFFSGSEIALVHADKLRLHHLAEQGNKGARLVLRLFRKPEVLLGTTLVGTNLSVVTLTTLGTLLMIRLLGENGDIYAFLIYSPLFLIFGEIVPKSVYQQKADELSPYIIYPLNFFSYLFYPIVFVFSRVARLVTRMVGIKSQGGHMFVSREKIRSVLEMAEQGVNVDVFDRDRIMHVVRYADMSVGEIMIPVADMSMIRHDQTTTHAVNLARERGHFRLPVYEDETTQVTGIVSFTLWDLMNPEYLQRPLTELSREACFVTPHQLLDELLPVLQQRDDRMAIVVDEFGSAIGMITLEDILEEVVGDIVNVGYHFEAFVPRHKYSIETLPDKIYRMDGRVPISEASEILGVELPTTQAHTVGGMVTAKLRHIPAAGESIIVEGYRFTVEVASDRFVNLVLVEST